MFLIGVGLIDLAGMRKVFAQRRSEFWVALFTALTVVVVGVEQGILLAIVLSLIDHTRHGYRPKNAVLVPDESGGWQPKPVATAASGRARSGHLPIHAQPVLRELPSSSRMRSRCSRAARTPPLRWLCFDAAAVDDVDYSAAETLRSVYARLKAKGIRLVVANEMEDLKTHTRYRLRELFGADAFYDRLKDVVNHYRAVQRRGSGGSGHTRLRAAGRERERRQINVYARHSLPQDVFSKFQTDSPPNVPTETFELVA